MTLNDLLEKLDADTRHRYDKDLAAKLYQEGLGLVVGEKVCLGTQGSYDMYATVGDDSVKYERSDGLVKVVPLAAVPQAQLDGILYARIRETAVLSTTASMGQPNFR